MSGSDFKVTGSIQPRMLLAPLVLLMNADRDVQKLVGLSAALLHNVIKVAGL